MNYPFALGVTSLTIPEKDLLFNVDRVPAGCNALEITMEYPRTLPLSPRELNHIHRVKGEKGLSITIHLPLSLEMTSPNPFMRDASLRTLEQVFTNSKILEPTAFVLHVAPFYKTGGTPLGRVFETILLEERLDATWDSLRRLSEMIDPKRIAIENLYNSFLFEEEFVRTLGFSVCMDVGHLLLDRADVYVHFNKFKDLIRVIHLHDVVNGRDHQQLGCGESGLDVKALLALIKRADYKGTVILEQFKPEHISESLATIAKAWESLDRL